MDYGVFWRCSRRGSCDVQKMGSVRKLTGSSRLPSRIRKTAWWGPKPSVITASRHGWECKISWLDCGHGTDVLFVGGQGGLCRK